MTFRQRICTVGRRHGTIVIKIVFFLTFPLQKFRVKKYIYLEVMVNERFQRLDVATVSIISATVVKHVWSA